MKKLFATLLSLSLILGPMPAAHASGGGIAKQILGIAVERQAGGKLDGHGAGPRERVGVDAAITDDEGIPRRRR